MNRLLLIFCGVLISCELFKDNDNPLAEGEIIQGLKEALTIGLNTSVTSASSADGYLQNQVIKILLPNEIKDLRNGIQTKNIAGAIPLSTVYNLYVEIENGGNDLFDELVTAMNRGAERAASKAGPIFLNAITNMTFDDARRILDGDETAATDYFYEATNTDLYTAFNPDVKKALDATGANEVYATTTMFLDYQYNAGFTTVSPGEVLNVGSLPSSIDEYATNKAIDGLFHLIGEEEKKIRANPFAWGSSIIERVFGGG